MWFSADVDVHCRLADKSLLGHRFESQTHL